LILNKLIWLFEEAINRDAVLICVGDLFDKKAGTTLRELYSLIDVLNFYRNTKKMNMILGNHDIQAYNQDISTQPAGILIESGLINLISDESEIDIGDGVKITGENYKANYEREETFTREVKGDYLFHIHLTHAMLVNKPVPFEAVMASDIEPFINADILINGHNHEPWEYADKIYNVGSVARIAKDKNYLNKQPKCLFIDGSTKEIEWVDIPVEKDVWLNKITRESMDSEALDEFVEKFNSKGLEDEDILPELLKGKSDDVKKCVYNYLGE
jgi:predicted phosphodiesterase